MINSNTLNTLKDNKTFYRKALAENPQRRIFDPNITISIYTFRHKVRFIQKRIELFIATVKEIHRC